MTDFPLPTLACTIDADGISAPDYADILGSLQAQYQAIFGSDVILTPDSQDGQFLAIFSTAQHDTNSVTIATYGQFSPATSQGAGLSSVVKINGIARQASSHSTAPGLVVGVPGTIIPSGIVSDSSNQRWQLPSGIVIGDGGDVVATLTAIDPGALIAEINTITNIVTPTRGWQTVTNTQAADPGNPVETDAQLRGRQTVSTAIPSLSVLDGIDGAVANLSGVGRHKLYENDTGIADGDGIPAHSISDVVEGGDLQTIGDTIARKKTPGTRTYGTTSVTTIDARGIPNTINFYVLAESALAVEVDITALFGYTSATGDKIIAAIVSAINALDVGTDSYLSKLFTAANLNGDPLNNTYNVTAIRQAIKPDMPAAANVVIAFDAAASLVAADVTLAVT